MENIKEIKEKFERGEISQEDMDIETQKKVANLYKEEIEQIRENITAIRKETSEYKKKIAELDKVNDLLDSED